MIYGHQGRLYRNTGTVGADPATLDLITPIRNLKVNVVKTEFATAEQGSSVEKIGLPLTQLSITFEIRKQYSGDTDYAALATAFHAGTNIDAVVLDGTSATNGAKGYRFEAKVIFGENDLTEGNVVYTPVTLKPALDGTFTPKSVAVASGAPVYTDLA